MNYKEIMALDDDKFMASQPDEVLVALKSLPWGYKELNEEYTRRLTDIHSVSAISVILGYLGEKKDNLPTFKNLCNQIFSIIPEGTHDQTFVIGQMVMISMFEQFFENTHV